MRSEVESLSGRKIAIKKTKKRSIQESQGYYIGCLEEISLNNGWITKNELSEFLITRPENSYYDYVRELI